MIPLRVTLLNELIGWDKSERSKTLHENTVKDDFPVLLKMIKPSPAQASTEVAVILAT